MKQLLLFVISTVFLLMVGCANTAETTTVDSQVDDESSSLPELSPDEIAVGALVYGNNCASCHGENLEGEADWKQQNEDNSFRSPPHSADGHTWHHADSVLIEAINEGGARYEELDVGVASNMPAFAATLTDEEVTAVLNYIKSTWPDDIRTLQWQQTIQNSSQ